MEKCLNQGKLNNIINLCYEKLKKKYKKEEYFDYCKKGNLEAVFICTKNYGPDITD